MKITDFKSFVVGNPPPHFGGRYWVFLKLTTDHGLAGYGEAYSLPFHPSTVTKTSASGTSSAPTRSRSSVCGGSSFPAATTSVPTSRCWAS
jgi:hypothetical protein